MTLDNHHDQDITRGCQLGHLVSALDRTFGQHRLDVVLVHGDATSALAGALAAKASGTPLVHLKAGLRSFDRAMPEEHHRVLIDHLATVEAVATALPDDQQQAQTLCELGLARYR